MKSKLILTGTALALTAAFIFPSSSEAASVVVQRGDTLWSISKKYNVGLSELMKLNNLSSHLIHTGQTLSVSKTTQPSPPSPSSQKQVKTNPSDPLNVRSTASMSGRIVGTLKHQTVVTVLRNEGSWTYVQYGGLKGYVYSNYLSSVQSSPPAQAPSVTKQTYTVKRGDTLYKIGQQFKVSYQTLAQWNNLTSYAIYPGQNLTVAKSESSPPSPAPTPAPTTPSQPALSPAYTVVKGDTLYRIALEHKTTVTALKKLNGLTSDLLQVGQTLRVSTTAFIRPTEGSVTSDFGYRTHPVTGETGSYHSGVDIAKRGTVPVVAAFDGVVARAEMHPSYGNVVFVLHAVDGKEYETVYAHLQSLDVSVGQRLQKGEKLGLMGSSGNVTGQHLHFELHIGRWNGGRTNAVDPLKYID